MLGLALQAAGSSDSVDQVAEGVGLAARRILAAYKGVNAALEGFGCIMKQHQALQVREGAMQDGRMLSPSFSVQCFHGSGACLCRWFRYLAEKLFSVGCCTLCLDRRQLISHLWLCVAESSMPCLIVPPCQQTKLLLNVTCLCAAAAAAVVSAQSVPTAVLQEERAVHSEEARMYSNSAAILQPAAAAAK